MQEIKTFDSHDTEQHVELVVEPGSAHASCKILLFHIINFLSDL